MLGFYLGFLSRTREEMYQSNPFESKEYSVWKNVLGLDWKKAVYCSFLVPVDPLFIAVILIFIKVNLVHFKEKTLNNSQLGKCLTCFNCEESVKRTLFGLTNTL